MSDAFCHVHIVRECSLSDVGFFVGVGGRIMSLGKNSFGEAIGRHVGCPGRGRDVAGNGVGLKRGLDLMKDVAGGAVGARFGYRG